MAPRYEYECSAPELLLPRPAPSNSNIENQCTGGVSRTQGIVLVYDVTDQNSFNNINIWLTTINEVRPPWPLDLE